MFKKFNSDVCGNGMFSSTGMIPCQLCPRHTFAGPPPIGGYKECEPCTEVNLILNYFKKIFK